MLARSEIRRDLNCSQPIDAFRTLTSGDTRKQSAAWPEHWRTFLTLEDVLEEVLFDNASVLVIEHDAQTPAVVLMRSFSPSPDIGASGHVPALPIVLVPRARWKTASPM